MADSDSDFDDMDEDDKPKQITTKKGKKRDTYIKEDPESIVDLADVNAIGRITSKYFCHILLCSSISTFFFFTLLATKPTVYGSNALIENSKKEKKPNRGFKTDHDGRLIIAEPKRGEAESDSGDDDDVADLNSGAAKKRSLEDDSDSEVDENVVAQQSARKRKAMDSHSMASGRTGASSKYMTGGKGIHRPVGSTGASSVKSGMSRMSMATTKSASSAFGGAFKAKKAKGDLKKAGKMDPYAYIPLSRNSLNRR